MFRVGFLSRVYFDDRSGYEMRLANGGRAGGEPDRLLTGTARLQPRGELEVRGVASAALDGRRRYVPFSKVAGAYETNLPVCLPLQRRLTLVGLCADICLKVSDEGR